MPPKMKKKSSNSKKEKVPTLPPPGSICMTKFRNEQQKQTMWYCILAPDDAELEEFSRDHNKNKKWKNTNSKDFLMRYGMICACAPYCVRAHPYVQCVLYWLYRPRPSCIYVCVRESTESASFPERNGSRNRGETCARFFACVLRVEIVVR